LLFLGTMTQPGGRTLTRIKRRDGAP